MVVPLKDINARREFDRVRSKDPTWQRANRDRRRSWRQTPEGKYACQRYGAKQRGIEWLFSFETWLKVWNDSGLFSQRGPMAWQYVMARNLDTGPYSPDNVLICTKEQNDLDREMWRREDW